ncbi:MAG: DUF262 domain-containing HNH endonuclease family protein [Pseudomonadota bacterium]
MMGKTFSAEPHKLGDLFSSPFFFRVPAYQRPFSWDRDNFADLVDDLVGADKSSEYFLGTLVLHRTDDDGNHDIVDGQQRLTSIAILLAALRDMIDHEAFKSDLQDKISQKENVVDGIPKKIRIEVRNSAVFDAYVAQPDGTVKEHHFASDTDTERRYSIAVEEYRTKLKSLTQDQLQNLVRFISQRCIVIVLMASRFEEAFRLFSIVNDRGKQLRRIDILKAVNLDPQIVPKDTVRESLAARWEELENEIGGDRFEDVFFMMRLIILKDKPQKDLFSEFQDRVFKRGLSTPGQVFLDTAYEYAELYKSIFLSRDYLVVDHKDYNRFVSLIHIMDCEFRASEWRACVVQFARVFGRERILEFAEKIQFLFVEHWATGIRKDERFSHYAAILHAIDNKGAKPQDAINAVNYDADKITTAITARNFYSLGLAKYVLLRLELLSSEMDQLRILNAKSIEHVLPQNPKDGSDWLSWHNKSEIPDYVHSIGNLVLLSKGKNSSAGNKEFSAKKDSYLKPRFVDFPRSAEVLLAQEWSKKTISDRTAAAALGFFNPI